MKENAVVSCPLDIGPTAQGIHSPTRYPDITKQKLKHGVRADHLGRVSVLGSAHGVHNRSRLSSLTSSAIGLGNLQVDIFGSSGYLTNSVHVVARIVFLHELEDTIWVLEGLILFRYSFPVALIAPGCLIVFSLLQVVTRKEPILKTKLRIDEKRSVGVLNHIFLVVQFVLQAVVDDSTDKRNIRS
ncbi:hypothetical protein ES703_123938 [subsurface metagenome]